MKVLFPGSREDTLQPPTRRICMWTCFSKRDDRLISLIQPSLIQSPSWPKLGNWRLRNMKENAVSDVCWSGHELCFTAHPSYGGWSSWAKEAAGVADSPLPHLLAGCGTDRGFRIRQSPSTRVGCWILREWCKTIGRMRIYSWWRWLNWESSGGGFLT